MVTLRRVAVWSLELIPTFEIHHTRHYGKNYGSKYDYVAPCV